MPNITYTAILKDELENIGGSLINSNSSPSLDKKKIENADESNFDIKEITLMNLLLEYPNLLKESNYSDYISNHILKEIYLSALEGRKMNEAFKAVNLINKYPENHIIHKIVTMESNEKSEDSAKLTVNEIINQLKKNSDEKVYFDLLNRYSTGQQLTQDEREFIKNFKK